MPIVNGSMTMKADVTQQFGGDLTNLSEAIGGNGTNLWTIKSGVSTDEADQLFPDTRTLTDAAFEELDLAGGILDSRGLPITFVKVKGIWINCRAANGAELIVGGAAANAFLGPFKDATDKISIAPGDAYIQTNRGVGWAVTPGSADLLRMEHDGTGTADLIYDIILVGTLS